MSKIESYYHYLIYIYIYTIATISDVHVTCTHATWGIPQWINHDNWNCFFHSRSFRYYTV